MAGFRYHAIFHHNRLGSVTRLSNAADEQNQPFNTNVHRALSQAGPDSTGCASDTRLRNYEHKQGRVIRRHALKQFVWVPNA